MHGWPASGTAQGVVVKSYTWEGNAVPPRILWNGKNDSGADVPEGLYDYFISCTDKAGNSARADIREISLTRKYELADITISSEYFSFKKDTALNFFPALSSIHGLDRVENHNIGFKDENGQGNPGSEHAAKAGTLRLHGR